MNDECKADSDGNCQHAANTGPRSWTIPLGTHIIGGRTVSANFSTGSVATNRQSAAPQQDNLYAELVKLFEGAGVKPSVQLMTALTMWVVTRDHKVMEHGFQLGKKAGRVQAIVNEEPQDAAA